MIISLYIMAIVALLIGTAAITMALFKPFPGECLYYHYFIRKPATWLLFLAGVLWVGWRTWQTGAFPGWTIIPLALMGLAIVLAYRMHQENVFLAVDFPQMADNVAELPLQDEMQLAVIEYEGETKAYPLDYVIHHHVVNDRFGEAVVSLTYCAMCRSIIPFDVTDIGPLFVGSFKNGNMIVADRKTKTFFQQATFESIIGPLHPHTLTMIPFQILPWDKLKGLEPRPQIAQVTEEDIRVFELPIPGIWRKIIASEIVPGLSAAEQDKRFPARTHVVGVTDPLARPQVVYLKEELLAEGVVKNETLDIFLVGVSKTVNGFKGVINDRPLTLTLQPNKTLTDQNSGTVWDIRGKQISGEIEADLEPVALSDEYWFSWKWFHPESQLIRL